MGIIIIFGDMIIYIIIAVDVLFIFVLSLGVTINFFVSVIVKAVITIIVKLAMMDLLNSLVHSYTRFLYTVSNSWRRSQSTICRITSKKYLCQCLITTDKVYGRKWILKVFQVMMWISIMDDSFLKKHDGILCIFTI